jgi:hypothetical protein
MALVDDIDWAGTIRWSGRYISISPKVWVGFANRVVCEAIRAVRGRRGSIYPSKLGTELGQSESAITIEQAMRFRPDMVTVEYSSLAPLLSGFPLAQRLVLLHDLFSLRAQSFIAQGLAPDHIALSLDEEARRCGDAQIMIHASCTELDALREKMPHAGHVWMRPTIPNLATSGHRPTEICAVFIGSVHAGNAEALTYLRTHVWPIVRRHVPTAKLHIIGTIAETIDPGDAEREGLALIGPVSDLSSAISTNAIGLAPMNFGSGIPIKIVDYFGLDLPVVATDAAVRPFGNELDQIVAVADTPQQFADHVIRLLQDDVLRNSAAITAKGVSERLVNDQLFSLLGR